MTLEEDKIHQRWGQTAKGVETIGMKIVEIVMIFGFGLGRKKNDDRMFQINIELESKRLFEETGRYQVNKNNKSNPHMRKGLKMGKQIRSLKRTLKPRARILLQRKIT